MSDYARALIHARTGAMTRSTLDNATLTAFTTEGRARYDAVNAAVREHEAGAGVDVVHAAVARMIEWYAAVSPYQASSYEDRESNPYSRMLLESVEGHGAYLDFLLTSIPPYSNGL